jgi:hypothetical protein
MAIGTAFLYNVDEFKIYSTYCANHSKAQKALHQSELFNQPLSLMIFHRGIQRGISRLSLFENSSYTKKDQKYFCCLSHKLSGSVPK